MLDFKTWLYAKLISNTPLVSALGNATKILFFYPKLFNTLPILAYRTTLIPNDEDGYADDAPYAETWEASFDIYVRDTDYTVIQLALDSCMTALGFVCDYGEDVADPTEGIRHWTCAYRRRMTADDISL